MIENQEEYSLRVIQIEQERGSFIRDVDGYFYWLPSDPNKGTMSAHHLRWIADELDRINAEWNKQVTKDLSEK